MNDRRAPPTPEQRLVRETRAANKGALGGRTSLTQPVRAAGQAMTSTPRSSGGGVIECTMADVASLPPGTLAFVTDATC